MTGMRSGVIREGDEIRLSDGVFTVVTLSGSSARLTDAVGGQSVVPLSRLLGDPALELVSGSRPALCSEEALAGVPEAAAERARWWERHLIEVLTGRRVDSEAGSRPRPEFDPASRSLRQRELAKLAELRSAGHEISLYTLQRQRYAYERDGLLGVVDRRHTFGSARTRRSLSKQPDGPFGALTVARPGEVVEIDSTPLDVRVVLDDGTVDRVELTGMVDDATCSIPAAVLRPTTKAVDAALLLARALTPEPMRPEWSDALRMSRSVLPYRCLTGVDQRLADAAARPVIAPETVVCDHGKAYLSQTFRQACCTLGINLQPAHPDTPTDKPKIERTLQSVATLFAQHVAGYVGSSVERRGKNAEQDAVWSIVELQALLDEWIVAVWQNRPHDGLRDPVTPGKALTPNEKYAALVEVAGYVPVPLSAEDYIELLPSCWRRINSYGIRVNNRSYDAKALNPYRRQHSGVESKKGQWEVHYDPYDVSRIWVRNHHDEGWLAATWTHLRSHPVPFGELVWQHARSVLAQRGCDQATEAEIARAADDLLDRAAQGPAPTRQESKDRRVAGRTRATATPAWPRPPDTAEPCDEEPPPGGDEDADDIEIAQVIPLPVFDARKEAESWRL